MTKNNNYKKTILMTLLIVPIFTVGITIGNSQMAYGGFVCIPELAPEPSFDPPTVEVTLAAGESTSVIKTLDPDENECFSFLNIPEILIGEDCFDSGFDENADVGLSQLQPFVFSETIVTDPDATSGEYQCTLIWILAYQEVDFNAAQIITVEVEQPILLTIPEPEPDEGCTSGFWKQAHHLGHWAPTGLSPEDTLASQFFVTSATPEASLLEALSLKGGKGIAGAEHILLRIAVAALLNAAHPDVGYPLTPEEVRTYVRVALAEYDRETILELKDMFDESNNAVCPIEGPAPEPLTCEECSVASSEALILCEGELNCKISVLQEFAECTLTCEGESNGIPEACFNTLSAGFSSCLDFVTNPDQLDTCEQEYVEQTIDCAANIPP